MALQLKQNTTVQGLALGYNYEVAFDASALSGATGAQATEVQLGGASLAGTIGKVAVVVDELVTADVSTGSAISDATLAVGDDGDANGFVVEIDCFTGDSSANKIFANNGALTQAGNHLVTVLNVTSNGTGNGLGDATRGKFRLFVEYYPTAGTGFSG